MIRRSISYHGNTLTTLSLSGRPNLQAPYQPMLQYVPETLRAVLLSLPARQDAIPACEVACVDELEAVILREGPETVSAFIAEPILGASAGAAVPPEDYARRAREICTKHGVLYIDDEVMMRLRPHGQVVRDRVEAAWCPTSSPAARG